METYVCIHCKATIAESMRKEHGENCSKVRSPRMGKNVTKPLSHGHKQFKENLLRNRIDTLKCNKK